MTMSVVIFLCGDVMLGRGIDQVLAHSVDPVLHEPYVQSAETYVQLAERVSGPIDQPVGPAYVWGDALKHLRTIDPPIRVINLETSVTTSDAYWRSKGIHYRMHPNNVDVLTAAGVDGCVLANNHVLDWGREGLVDTLQALEDAGIAGVGAGRDAEAAAAPMVFEPAAGARVVVFACAVESSGVPGDWEATGMLPGVNRLESLDGDEADRLIRHIGESTRAQDIVVLSIHWGGNWGWDIPEPQTAFAHRLIDEAGVDIVHGHSSHHVKGIEVYRDRLILYGCGDLINDYEGIGGHEAYRPELSLLYLPAVDPADGRLTGLRLIPMRMRRFRLDDAADDEAEWLRRTLDEQSAPFGVNMRLDEQGAIVADWPGAKPASSSSSNKESVQP